MTTWLTWWPRIAIGVLFFTLLAPFAMAFGARSLADVPAAAPAASLPPMPSPAPDASPSLDGLVDSLPMVVRDLPDEESRAAVDVFDQATLLDSRGGRDMFARAWSSLVVSPEYDDEMAMLAAELMPEHVSPSFGSAGPAIRDRANPLLASVMPDLRRDPDNAARLNNAAVSLFVHEVEMLYGSQPFGEECGIRGSDRYLEGAFLLLEETDRAFETNRAVVLNLGFLASLDGNVSGATIPISRLLAEDPADRTARLLLGNLLARQTDSPDALETAITVLTPLLDDHETEALGHAALGDAYLTAALGDIGVSPFLSHQRGTQALTAYDRALALTTDPGVYAGRAAALDLLGHPEEAARALAQAVERAPGSISLRIGLALLYQRSGDFDRMREHARIALDDSSDGWNPRIVDLRYVRSSIHLQFDPIEPGYMSFSYGSDRDLVPIRSMGCGAGGGYITTLNLFPTEPPWAMRNERFDLAPNVAVALNQSASVLLGDAEGAASAWDDWDRASQRTPRIVRAQYSTKEEVVGAAQLISGGSAGSEVEQGTMTVAERELVDAGQYARAIALCSRVDPQMCDGRVAYLVGDYELASSSLYAAAEPAIKRFEDGVQPEWYADDALAMLRAADAAREAGDESRARDLYSIVASQQKRSTLFAAIAYTKLAELELDSSDPGQAITHLDVALELIHSRTFRDQLSAADSESAGPAAQAMQVAHNNRGIARLWEAKGGARGAPDCTRHRDLCLGAKEDFTVALGSDPANPVYLLNMGWVSRLLDDTEAARVYLTESTGIDPSLYPSYNDLGVFAASDGDWQQAHEAFMDAAAANPGYDLALWNLGVLELGRGGLGVLSGQGYLARAIEQNRALRDDSEVPAFQKDERIYRVALDAPVGNGFRFSQASSVAAGLLGAISFIAAIKLTLKNLLPDSIFEWTWQRRARVVQPLGRHADTLRRLRSGAIVLSNRATGRVTSMLGEEPYRTIVARHAALRPPERWRAAVACVATVAVLVGVTVWPVWRDGSYVRSSLVLLALFAVVSALVIHEAGHYLAAWVLRARIRHTQWPPGMVLAPVLMPFGLNGGPFVCQLVEGADKAKAWWIYLSGPAANLLAALVMYLLFLAEPLPVLRLLAIVHVAAAGYALLPYHPLDGAHLNERWPAVASVAGFTVTFVSILFVVGRL